MAEKLVLYLDLGPTLRIPLHVFVYIPKLLVPNISIKANSTYIGNITGNFLEIVNGFLKLQRAVISNGLNSIDSIQNASFTFQFVLLSRRGFSGESCLHTFQCFLTKMQ